MVVTQNSRIYEVSSNAGIRLKFIWVYVEVFWAHEYNGS